MPKQKSQISLILETNKNLSEETYHKQRKFIWKGEAHPSEGNAKPHSRYRSVANLRYNKFCFCLKVN